MADKVKYNVGDRFVIEIKRIHQSSGLYEIEGLNALITEDTLDELADQNYGEKYLESITGIAEQSYNNGLSDAWELANKVFFDSDLGGFESSEIKEIFGTVYAAECFKGDIHKAIKKYKVLQVRELQEVDWSAVEVDTPILVRDSDDEPWEKRHFAKYEEGKIYAWRGFGTSWTCEEGEITIWDMAKLPEE